MELIAIKFKCVCSPSHNLKPCEIFCLLPRLKTLKFIFVCLGCGKKRSDPGMLNDNALSNEAEILAAKMLGDMQQYEMLQNRIQATIK